jgi:uncharacterized repeat protein (TIGR03803 family)
MAAGDTHVQIRVSRARRHRSPLRWADIRTSERGIDKRNFMSRLSVVGKRKDSAHRRFVMKSCIQQPQHAAMAAISCMLLIGQLGAQTLTNVHNFSYGSGLYLTNSDGAGPGASPALAGGPLYGTASRGGLFGYGAVFAVNVDGSGFTNLHSFTQYSDNHFGVYTNADGANPGGSLILSGDTLFGTTSKGGIGGSGAVFALRTDGSGFTNLYNFAVVPPSPGPYTNSDGAWPSAGLLVSGTTLFGTTSSGGSFGSGTVFALNSDGTGFTNLHYFSANTGYPTFINADGSGPQGKLVLSANRLYGTTASGGVNGNGAVFALNADGSGFTNLHSFAATYYTPIYTNNEGAKPQAELLLSGNMLYGTANAGGWFGQGSVFGLTTNGTGFTNLHSFTPLIYSASQYTNGDGAGPTSGLVMQGGALFGTASKGGPFGHGILFKVKPDGTEFEDLHSFTGMNGDGDTPKASLVSFGGAFFGTTSAGGTGGGGTVFSYSIAPGPILTITVSGTNVVIAWPTASAGFVLQSAPAVSGPFTNFGGAGNPYTNPIIGASQFFRLSK